MVKRYAAGWVEGSDRIYMHELSNGNYVDHADYAALAERCERLEAALRKIAGHGRDITGAPDMIAIASDALGLTEKAK